MRLRNLLVVPSLFAIALLPLPAQAPPARKAKTRAGKAPVAAEPAAEPAAPDDALGAMAWVPKGASAVILVNHPARTLESLSHLAGRMNFKGAALTRETLVEQFGGEPLLDPASSLVEFTYPVAGDKPEGPTPTVQVRIMRVPVLATFHNRFKPKPLGTGFSEVSIGRKPVAMAFRGGYAIFVPKAQLATLKELLAEREVFVLPPTSQRPWILEQDLAMIFPVEVMAENATAPAPARKPAQPLFAPLEKMLERIRKHPGDELTHVAIGTKTEEAGGISFEARIGFQEHGQVSASLASLQGTLQDLGASVARGLPATPFAVAFTGMVPSGYPAWLGAALPAEDSAATPEQKAKAAAAQELVKGLKAYGFVWAVHPGAAAGSVRPLDGSVLALQVEDAEVSLSRFEAYGKLDPGSAPRKSEFKGRSLLSIAMEPPKAPAPPAEGEAPKAPPVDPSAFFGKGPLTTLAWAYDPHTVLVGFGDAERAEEVFRASIESLEAPEKGLGRQPAFALAQDMLGGEQQFQVFLSLQGILTAIGAVLPLPIQIPETSKNAPPLGLGFSLDSHGLSVKAVAPAETVELVGSLVESAMKLSQEAKKAAQAEGAAAEHPDAAPDAPADKPAPKPKGRKKH